MREEKWTKLFTYVSNSEKKPKMMATETTEDTEGKYSVFSGYSVAKIIHYTQKLRCTGR